MFKKGDIVQGNNYRGCYKATDEIHQGVRGKVLNNFGRADVEFSYVTSGGDVQQTSRDYDTKHIMPLD